MKVAAFIPDLMFGSRVVAMLSDHEVALVGRPEDLDGALAGARVVVVDLTDDSQARIAAVLPRLGDVASLAFYAHVEADVRAAAEAAGFDLVVPRSRMAREGAALVERLGGG